VLTGIRWTPSVPTFKYKTLLEVVHEGGRLKIRAWVVTRKHLEIG
jgi:hypothetical protein